MTAIVFMIGLVTLLGYFEVRDYRQARRIRRMQAAFSHMARRVDGIKADIGTLATLPDRVGMLAENLAKLNVDVAEVLGSTKFLEKEYETVLHYRKQIASSASADFYEG